MDIYYYYYYYYHLCYFVVMLNEAGKRIQHCCSCLKTEQKLSWHHSTSFNNVAKLIHC